LGNRDSQDALGTVTRNVCNPFRNLTSRVGQEGDEKEDEEQWAQAIDCQASKEER